MKVLCIILLTLLLIILNKLNDKKENFSEPKPNNSITTLHFNCIQGDVNDINDFIDNKYDNVCTENGNDNNYKFIKTIGRTRLPIKK